MTARSATFWRPWKSSGLLAWWSFLSRIDVGSISGADAIEDSVDFLRMWWLKLEWAVNICEVVFFECVFFLCLFFRAHISETGVFRSKIEVVVIFCFSAVDVKMSKETGSSRDVKHISFCCPWIGPIFQHTFCFMKKKRKEDPRWGSSDWKRPCFGGIDLQK